MIKDMMKVVKDIGAFRVSGVTDSIFKYTLVSLIFTIISAAIIGEGIVTTFCMSVTGLLLLVGLFTYIRFSIIDPSQLRSESFNLKNKGLDLMGDDKNSDNKNITQINELLKESSTNPNNIAGELPEAENE